MLSYKNKTPFEMLVKYWYFNALHVLWLFFFPISKAVDFELKLNIFESTFSTTTKGKKWL